MRIFLIVCCWIFTVNQSFAQEIYPTNWWVGMKWNKVQLLVHGASTQFNKGTVSINYPGVQLLKTTPLDNGRYFAVDIEISPETNPGNVPVQITHQKKTDILWWPLYKRREGRGTQFAQGVSSPDFIYLLMPDRFSNGDYTNDRIPGMLDQSLNRDSLYERHGGDLKGVINHLDYLQELGVTALWLTPVLENDLPAITTHGYAVTNEYKIDPRYGGEQAYEALSDSLHKRGMKLIEDAVFNHVGIKNIFFMDPPVNDWVHHWPNYTNTSYKDQPLMDPYAAQMDKDTMSNGWFTPLMPDLNQSDPYVANFLIQHAIWYIERFGIDGVRIDTYAYNDLAFMNRCNSAIKEEYPHISIFGETWVHGVIDQSYFCENNYTNIPFKSNLPGTTDYQELLYGILPALNDKFEWTGGVNKLYSTTAQDFVYKNPMNEVIFLDNHDLPRFYSVIGENINKYKMGIGWLLTFRGIPQLYYGTEILMKGFTNPDGYVRMDFKGGWKEDLVNKFTPEGRTADENTAFNYLKTLANFRKNSPALTIGKLRQYVPQEGLYTYFRYTSDQTIMCIMNTDTTSKTIDWSKGYNERTQGFSKARDIITNEEKGTTVQVPAQSLLIFELEK
jgi:glycosidase